MAGSIKVGHSRRFMAVRNQSRLRNKVKKTKKMKKRNLRVNNSRIVMDINEI